MDSDLALQGTKLAHLVGQDQRHDHSGGAGPGGAARAMEVVLVVPGEIEVDHAVDPVDMDTPGGHIGGDQGIDLPVAEGLQGPGALALAATAMDRLGFDAHSIQLSGDLVGAVPGSGEHEGRRGRLDDLGRDVDPLGGVDPPEVVGSFEMILVVADFVADGIGLIALGQSRRHRCRGSPRTASFAEPGWSCRANA